jgi:hypothetical protein
MYKVIVDGVESDVNFFELHPLCFMLKCEGKSFTIIYPSGYVGVFNPIKK